MTDKNAEPGFKRCAVCNRSKTHRIHKIDGVIDSRTHKFVPGGVPKSNKKK